MVSGSQVSGCFHRLNEPSARILIGEGYATCASVLQSLQGVSCEAVHVAMAGSSTALVPVSIALRICHPCAEIVIVADDDEPGRVAAQEAAARSGASVITATCF